MYSAYGWHTCGAPTVLRHSQAAGFAHDDTTGRASLRSSDPWPIRAWAAFGFQPWIFGEAVIPPVQARRRHSAGLRCAARAPRGELCCVGADVRACLPAAPAVRPPVESGAPRDSGTSRYDACVCLTGAAGRVPMECARACHQVPPVRDAWPARDRPRAWTGARRGIPCADAAVGAYGEQISAAAVVRMCSQLRLRALRMQVGGLVSHRVASMHALAHAGSQGHALTRIQEHPHRNTQTRARMEKECTSACSTNAQARAHMRRLQGTPR